jgi:bifunctional non-homologous end joining protein LigD
VVEVAFTSWTSDGVPRYPSFEGIREDKAAQDVRLERPRPSARTARTTEV